MPSASQPKTQQDAGQILWDTKVQYFSITIIVIITIIVVIIIIIISRYHLTFKIVQADAKIVSQIFHAHGFHEVIIINMIIIIMTMMIIR